MSEETILDGGDAGVLDTAEQESAQEVVVDSTQTPDAETAQEPEQAPVAVIPEAYELSEDLSEDASVMAEVFSDTAKELGLDQEGFGKVAEFLDKVIAVKEKTEQDTLTEARTSWVKDLKSDKDFGGVNFESNVKIANTALDRFGSDDLKVLLNETGLNSNPAMVRFMHSVGKALQDGEYITNDGMPSPVSRTAEEILYPDLPKE